MNRIITSRPVNRQSAMVTGRGVHWEPKKNLVTRGFVRSDNPLPTQPWPKDSKGQDNLTGRIVGRLTVVGMSAGSRDNGRGARWVVRCSCGAYEHRRTYSLRKTDPAMMMCRNCDYLEALKAGRVP